MLDKMKIMAVDDNTVNLATIEQELKDQYEVIPMLTGRRAIKYLYREKVDLILLDVQMPIMDGIETLKEIRTLENGITTPVIFLTAMKDKDTVIEGSKLGIMDYITKPFDPDDLKSRIEQAFKRLGVLPMEQEELYERIVDINSNLKAGNVKPALKKVDEVLRYQIEEEISGRMRVVKQKLEQNDSTAAMAMAERVVTYMERNMENSGSSIYPPISLSELSAKLLYIQDDITNFRTHEATEKLVDIRNYDIPDNIRGNLNLAIDKLNGYDETDAQRLIKTMLDIINEEMGKRHDNNVEENEPKTSGYRARYFNKRI